MTNALTAYPWHVTFLDKHNQPMFSAVIQATDDMSLCRTLMEGMPGVEFNIDYDCAPTHAE